MFCRWIHVLSAVAEVFLFVWNKNELNVVVGIKFDGFRWLNNNTSLRLCASPERFTYDFSPKTAFETQLIKHRLDRQRSALRSYFSSCPPDRSSGLKITLFSQTKAPRKRIYDVGKYTPPERGSARGNTRLQLV